MFKNVNIPPIFPAKVILCTFLKLYHEAGKLCNRGFIIIKNIDRLMKYHNFDKCYYFDICSVLHLKKYRLDFEILI